jgi:hypothetical protein
MEYIVGVRKVSYQKFFLEYLRYLLRYYHLFFYYTINDTMFANGVFDLKHLEYNEKQFSWIYSNSANEAVQNGNKRLI